MDRQVDTGGHEVHDRNREGRNNNNNLPACDCNDTKITATS